MRTPLPLNTTVHLRPLPGVGKAVPFAIQRYLGAGGNCLAYVSTYRDASGTPHTGLLKEVFPYRLTAGRMAGSSSLNIPPAMLDAFSARLQSICDQYTQVNAYVSEHPETANVVTQLHSVYSANNTCYLFFELSWGESYDHAEEEDLRALLRRMIALSASLRTLHSFGLLHLDIKPSNILLDSATGALRLIDFDSLHRTPISPEVLRFLSCSAGFSPIEQQAGHVSQIGMPTDIYALAAVLYHKLYGRAPYSLNPVRLDVPYQTGSPLFTKMRLETYRILCRILRCALAASPSMRYQQLDDWIADLNVLLQCAERDLQAGLPLYGHMLSAYALSQMDEAAASAYLDTLCAQEPFTPDRIKTCLCTAEDELFRRQRWSELLYICPQLLRLGEMPNAIPQDSTSPRIRAENLRMIVKYMMGGYNSLGLPDAFHAFLSRHNRQKLADYLSPLYEAEAAKDRFQFEEALALAEQLIREYTPDLTHSEPERRYTGALSLLCAYGKKAQVLCHMNCYTEETFDCFRQCISLAERLEDSRVHQLTSYTYWLNAASTGGSKRMLAQVQRAFVSCLFALTRKPAFAVRAPQDYVRLLRTVLDLPGDTADYHKSFLIHAVLCLVRRRGQDDGWRAGWQEAARDILTVFDGFAQASRISFIHHPFELIAKLIAQLAAACGDTQTAKRYLNIIRTVEPHKAGSFLELLICCCCELEICTALSMDASEIRSRLYNLVQEEMHAHQKDPRRTDALMRRLAPMLDKDASADALLGCMTYIYR